MSIASGEAMRKTPWTLAPRKFFIANEIDYLLC